MKKILVVLLAVVFLFAAVGASAAALPLKFGVKAGMSMADVSEDTFEQELEDMVGMAPDAGMRMGLVGGLFVGIPLGTLTVQPEALYMQKGKKYEMSGTGYSASGTMALDYIEFPVLLKMGFGPGPAKPCIFVGPSLGVLLGAKAKYEVTSLIGSMSGDEDIKEGVKSTDISLVFGGGVDVGKLTIDVRYVLGLSNIVDAGDVPAGVEIPEAKNTAIMAMLGYSFL